VSDDYHGVRVADPYRWLEDDGRPDTRAWVDAQNRLTARLLSTSGRDAIRSRLVQLYDFPRMTPPDQRGARYFFTHNDGLQNQAVLYVQDGPSGRPRVLLDPNLLSDDGTVALTAMAPNEDGTLVAYALSRQGSDWQEIRVRDVASGADLPDEIRWAKFTDIAWTKDGQAFYYCRFPEPGTVPDGHEHYFCRIHLHRIGDAQRHDRLIVDRPDDREVVFHASVSTDGRWLVITAFRGSSDDSEVSILDLAREDAAPRPLFTGVRAAYAFVDAAEGRLYFRTTSGAPLGRLVMVDASRPLPAGPSGEVPMTTVVGEDSDTLSTATMAGGHLVAVYLRHASDRVRVFDLTGRQTGTVPLPGLGTIAAMAGRADERDLFLRFSSFTDPPAVYRYDVDAGDLVRFSFGSGSRPSATAVPGRREPDYLTTQVWYPSKDGTRISMFLIHRRDLERPGERPVFLTGYGGFNISLTPQYDPAHVIWLERGGVVAVPNLRGGGEYGDAWHRAGMFEHKQNVFDDFIAAAEWLIAEQYTTAGRIAIEGASNGGLLVGAALVQRPDLFGAAVCRVPVADMLRYHRFTVGRFWVSEYGSADDPGQFRYLHKYSPLHNVRDGVRYPPTLIMTADTDDRVAPGMARKFAARLQAATAASPDSGPILIRVETRAGHGAGKPVAKLIEEEADIYAFLARYLV
jgi:prolyl oligopeptidase